MLINGECFDKSETKQLHSITQSNTMIFKRLNNDRERRLVNRTSAINAERPRLLRQTRKFTILRTDHVRFRLEKNFNLSDSVFKINQLVGIREETVTLTLNVRNMYLVLSNETTSNNLLRQSCYSKMTQCRDKLKNFVSFWPFLAALSIIFARNQLCKMVDCFYHLVFRTFSLFFYYLFFHWYYYISTRYWILMKFKFRRVSIVEAIQNLR